MSLLVVVEGRVPRLLVECEWEDAEVDWSLRYLKARFADAEAGQISATGKKASSALKAFAWRQP